MPTTRKKVIKTVFKDEEDSEVEEAFSDSGSEAQISDESSSEDEIDEPAASSGDEFAKTKKPKQTHTRVMKRTKFAKSFINKINKQMSLSEDADEIVPAVFSIKDMTDEDKLLPSVLNLSESDSSDDESEMAPPKLSTTKTMYAQSRDSGSEDDDKDEYKDVWSNNVNDESEEIARKAFMELEQHKSKLEETKASIHQYSSKIQKNDDYDVKDLLAQGEEVLPKQPTPKKKIKSRKAKDESDSDMDDWEEVRESKSIPQQGLQLIVDLPNSVCRKTKKIDVEMMMKRKINRVKKEYQVYMHKVHVLCWLGHGNYVSKVLNDQELLAASLTLVPSKVCYPGERVDMKYIEQITTWYKDKLTLKQDKNENKYKPKAPPLKDLLISQIKSRVVTTRKYLVYIFVCLLRALGLQCRVMFNFVTLPIKPPNSELCSLSTKPKDEKVGNKENPKETNKRSVSKSSTGKKNVLKKSVPKEKISQVDGTDEEKTNYLNCLKIAQLDGNDDILQKQTRSSRIRKTNVINNGENDVSPPKRSKQIPKSKTTKNVIKSTTENDHKQGYNTSTNKIENSEIKGKVNTNENALKLSSFIDKSTRNNKKSVIENKVIKTISKAALKADESKNELSTNTSEDMIIPRKTRSDLAKANNTKKTNLLKNPPKIVIAEMESNNSSKYFNETKSSQESIKLNNTRKRSRTATPNDTKNEKEIKNKLNTQRSTKTRTKSAPCPSEESKYFIKDKGTPPNQCKKPKVSLAKHKTSEDLNRVSHRDLAKTREKSTKNDVTGDLVGLIKGRIKEAKEESKKGIVKGKMKKESDNDSDYLPEEDSLPNKFADSDDDFKPSKISPKPSTSKITKIDRRVLSSDEDIPKNKVDVWCEVFVEELEQWIPVDVVKGRVHCAENIYSNATHPVCYIVGWDNNNYLKDLTRRYVPHWNTATRKQRAEPAWWNKAVELWLGPKNARDREEDEQLDRMQLEAPLPKSIAEYKNHPLYALKRHLLKYEALYPPDAAILGFVRQEPVYARECVYVCRSRDTWLKEAKVVKLREQPYKVVKARPKWDKLSNKLITDKPLEIFGPWQVQDYEPPVAENGVVPRNAYGNVELFKDCMLPKGTVHIKLPGLNKVAKKLNIDCAPAMTGFDFNGGWSHPVYDGFVVCKEFEEIITEAWLKDQEDQERREIEKTEARVYGNWRRLIRGLWVRERLKDKYGFEEPSTSQDSKKSKGPRLVVKKK